MQTLIYLVLGLVGWFVPTILTRPGHRTSVFIVNASFGWRRALFLAARSWEDRR